VLESIPQAATVINVLSHPTWDIVVIFALIAGGFFYGISAGKSRIAATLLYTYVAFGVFSVLPLSSWFKGFNEVEELWVKTGIFLGLFLLLAFALGSRKNRGFAPASAWWKIFLLSFLQMGLVIHILLSFLPPGRFELAPITKTVFANPAYTIWWFLAPLLVLIFLRRIENE